MSNRNRLIIGGVAITLIGVSVGMILANYLFNSNLNRLCARDKSPEEQLLAMEQQAGFNTDLVPGKTLFGSITKKDSGSITFSIELPNGEQREVVVPMTEQDTISRFQADESGNVSIAQLSISDISVGDIATVKILDANRKAILLPAQQ